MLTPLTVISYLQTDKIAEFPSPNLSFRFSSQFQNADTAMLQLYIKVALKELSCFTNLTFKEHLLTRHRNSNLLFDLQYLSPSIYGTHSYPVGSRANITFNLRFLRALNKSSERHLINHLICGALGVIYTFNPSFTASAVEQKRINQYLSFGVRSAVGYQLPEVIQLRKMYGHKDSDEKLQEYYYLEYLNRCIINDGSNATLNLEGLSTEQRSSIEKQLKSGEQHLIINRYNWISILNPDKLKLSY
jgi:hypothetical protein